MISSQTLLQFSTTVEKIYEASFEPELWPEAVASIANLHDTPKANLLTPTTSPANGGFIFPVGFPEAEIQLWGQKYVAHDVWARRVVERDLAHEGNVILGSELVTDAELESSLFYREFLSRHDTWHLCTGIVFDGRKTTPPLTAMSLFKGRKQQGFSTVDRSLYQLTVNHVSRALGTMFLLRDAELRVAATLAALDRFSGAVLLFGRRGNVLFSNRGANSLLQTQDGLHMSSGNSLLDGAGWLLADNSSEDARLKKEIRNCVAHPFEVDHFGRGLRFTRPSGKNPYVFRISPLATRNEFSRAEKDARAIAFITDPDLTPSLDAGTLKSVFGLTEAECALAQAVLAGESLAATAHHLGISENTAKTQLQSVFDKTGTHRQAQLVKLLMGLASIVAPPGAKKTR